MNPKTIASWADYLVSLHQQNGGNTEIRFLYKDETGKGCGQSRTITSPQHLQEVVEGLARNVELKSVTIPILMESGNYYTTLNPIKAESGKASKDSDATAYLWLPVDIDPIRFEKDEFGVPQQIIDQKVNTSEEELTNAKSAADLVEGLIEAAIGVPCTVSACSGNGHHRLWRVTSGKMKETETAVHAVLKTLAQIFNKTPLKQNWVNIDTKVANPSRIWKLYGTLSRKGNDAKRPPRLSFLSERKDGGNAPRLLTVEDLVILNKKLNDYLQKHAPVESTIKTDKARTNLQFNEQPLSEVQGWQKKFAGFDLMTFDVDAALAEAGIDVIKELDKDGRTGYAVNCPNAGGRFRNENLPAIDAGGHSNTSETEAVIWAPRTTESGKRSFASFDCKHDHCYHISGSCGAEFLHSNWLEEALVKKYCQRVAPEKKEMPQPYLDNETPKEGKPAFEAPKPVRIDRSKIKGKDWYLAPICDHQKREELVDGLLFRGEVMTINAGSKIGKTFQLMHMAQAWANGLPFLGITANKRLRVLYVDPELLEDQGRLRLHWIATNITSGDLEVGIEYINLRYDRIMATEDPWGLLMDSISDWINLEGCEWDLIVVDSMYQFQGNRDVNSSGEVVKMMNKLKVITCGKKGDHFNAPAIAYVHHFAKGDPGLKKTMDRSAGSFAFSAAADIIMTFTEHPLTATSEEAHFNVEWVFRHHRKRETVVVKKRSDIPILELVEGAKPEVDSAFLLKKRKALDMIIILDDLLNRRVSEHQTYCQSKVPLKEWREACERSLKIKKEDFDKCRKIAEDDEGWIKGEGAGIARNFHPTVVGRAVIEEASEAKRAAQAAVDHSDDSDDKPEDLPMPPLAREEVDGPEEVVTV